MGPNKKPCDLFCSNDCISGFLYCWIDHACSFGNFMPIFCWNGKKKSISYFHGENHCGWRNGKQKTPFKYDMLPNNELFIFLGLLLHPQKLLVRKFNFIVGIIIMTVWNTQPYFLSSTQFTPTVRYFLILVCILSADGVIHHYRTFLARILTLVYSNKIQNLKTMRKQLKQKI